MTASRSAAPVLALLIVTGWSLPSMAQPETGGTPAAQGQPTDSAPDAPEVLTAARDRDGTHVILSTGSDGSFAVHVGRSTNPKPLKVLSVSRDAPNFHVDTLELGEITFNTVQQTVIIRGDIGFVQKNPTRTFTLRPKQIAVRRALGEVPPRVTTLGTRQGGNARLRSQDTRQADTRDTRTRTRRPGWLGGSRTTPARDARRGAQGSSSQDVPQAKNRVRKVRKGPR